MFSEAAKNLVKKHRGSPPYKFVLEHILTLPLSPVAFRNSHPKQYYRAFPSADPVPCPYSRTDVDAVVSAVPMRFTLRRKFSGATEPPPAAAALINAFQPQDPNMMLSLLAQVVQRLQHPSGAVGDGTPNLRVSPFATPSDLSYNPTPLATPTPLASPREKKSRHRMLMSFTVIHNAALVPALALSQVFGSTPATVCFVGLPVWILLGQGAAH